MTYKNGIKAFFAHQAVKRLLVFLTVATVCFFIAIVILSSKPPERTTVKDADSQVTGMPVSVHSVKPAAYPAIVSALGEVVPLWQTATKAQVDGKIVFLSERLQVANIVKQGELLVRVEKSQFEMRVAEAKSRLAAAKIDLLKEKQEGKEAQKNWKKSGLEGEPASLLVLRGPQLAVARSEVNAAQATLSHVKTLLGYTDIRVPLDGIIMKRSVNPGESLFAGDDVATLYSMNTVEVGVQLDATQLALLPESIYDTKVALNDPQQLSTWEARVVRDSRRLRRDSRLGTIFLHVKNPLRQTPPLLPGTFVRADMTGRDIPDLLCIPEAALTKEGIVWFVDSVDRLTPKRLEPVFYGKGKVYIKTPENINWPLRVAVSPNSSFISGLVIQPVAK